MKLAAIFLSLSLVGCAQYRAAVGSYGEEMSDAALHDSIWAMCSAIPVGAVKRRFKTEGERDAYNKLCATEEIAP